MSALPILIAAGLGAWALSRKAKAANELQYAIRDVKILRKKTNLSQVAFQVKIQMRNPNPVQINVDRVEINVALNGSHIADTQITSPFSIPADGTATQGLPIIVKSLATGIAVIKAIKNPDTTISFTGNVWPGGLPAIPINETYKLRDLV